VKKPHLLHLVHVNELLILLGLVKLKEQADLRYLYQDDYVGGAPKVSWSHYCHVALWLDVEGILQEVTDYYDSSRKADDSCDRIGPYYIVDGPRGSGKTLFGASMYNELTGHHFVLNSNMIGTQSIYQYLEDRSYLLLRALDADLDFHTGTTFVPSNPVGPHVLLASFTRTAQFQTVILLNHLFRGTEFDTDTCDNTIWQLRERIHSRKDDNYVLVIDEVSLPTVEGDAEQERIKSRFLLLRAILQALGVVAIYMGANIAASELFAVPRVSYCAEHRPEGKLISSLPRATPDTLEQSGVAAQLDRICPAAICAGTEGDVSAAVTNEPSSRHTELRAFLQSQFLTCLPLFTVLFAAVARTISDADITSATSVTLLDRIVHAMARVLYLRKDSLSWPEGLQAQCACTLLLR